MGKLKMIVFALDDDPGDLELLKRYMEDIPAWDIEFIAFTDCKKGREELARRSVDVIFLDYMLGSETGLQILEGLRESGDERPIIVLTGRGDEHIAAEITRAGADDYLVKGEMNPDMLRRAVNGAIKQYELRREKALLAEELRQAQKMETIGTLAGGIAHDFNNMLTAIMGYVELAALKTRGREVEQDLSCIQSTCRQMAELVQRLLSFSRRESSSRSQVNLSRIIRETETVLRHTLPKHVDFRIDLPDDPLVFLVNASMLHQVILNLCINASDAMTESGTLTISAGKITVDDDFKLSHPDFSHGEYIKIEVMDTGTGMSKEVCERIFDPFFTTKTLGTKKGTGLGLSVVWQNIKSQGGFIDVMSEIGRGTTFHIYLPAVQEAVEQTANSAPVNTIPNGSETVLIIDDERIVLDLAGKMLNRIGYSVFTAQDGRAGIDIFSRLNEKIDAVILDISMPKMGGKECLKHLLDIDQNVCVLFSSGHDIMNEADELMEMGAKGVIQKPYTLSALANKVRSVLDE